jgi:HK97 family phage portal protein
MPDENEAIEDIVEMRSGISRVFEEIVEQRKTVAGVAVSPEASLQCSGILAAVKVVSESVASLPLHLYERTPDGKKIAEEHPLYDVLAHAPNDWMTAYEFKELMQSWRMLWGVGYAQIKPGRRGAVDQLIPLHPSRMKPERLKNGKLRYAYQEPEKPTPTYFRQDEVFAYRGLSPDGVNCYVPTTLMRDAIGLARATELHSSAFFGHGARAGTVIENDQPLKPETLQRLREQWNDLHGRGPQNAYKTAVLPHGSHVKELSVNNDTNRLIETRRYQLEEVGRAFRVPAYMLGDMTKSSYSSVEQQAIDFVTFTLVPDLRRFEAACRRDLVVDDKRYFAQFDVSALLVGDFTARASFLREMWNLGVFSTNEVRQQLGYNPVDGGDKRFVQVNMQLLDNYTVGNPTAAPTKVSEPAPEQPAADAPQEQPVPTDPAASDIRGSADVLFTSTLRRLAAIEADGILERRNKPAKLAAWFEAHGQRMRTELQDAATATGRDIDEFVTAWMDKSRDLLLDCHRSGKPYEEVTGTWTDRATLKSA